MRAKRSVLIVGGGVVGLATAYRLCERFSDFEVTIVEKESIVGVHQSTHNSGVLHSGLYYKPGSEKARLAVSGIQQMVDFCRAEDIPHEICGKLVVATSPAELPRLEELLRRGQANGLEGLRKLEPNEMRKLEPHVAGVAAAHVPQEGIVDYRAVCDRLLARIQERGTRVVNGSPVKRLVRSENRWIATTPADEFSADFLINCAGLYCDRLAELAGVRRETRIVPFRGEYYKLSKESQHLVRNLIYPVPDPQFPFLGVHFTRLIRGGIEAGPNAVLAFSREGYTFGKVNPYDLFDALAFPGLWRFLRKYPSMVTTEIAHSFSKERFCRSLQKLVPEVRPVDLERGGAGVRAQAMTPQGELVQDFQIIARDNALHVLNAPSPAATASLAIGAHIAGLLPS